MLFNFKKLVTRYCLWRHSDVLINSTRKKNLGVKNMQNLARFRMTLKFGGEYLRNGWRYSKLDSHSIYRDSSCVRRNKSGEVWSSDLGDLDVESYPPKVDFSEDHIEIWCSTPRVLRPQIFTRARESRSLTSAPPTRDGGPPYNFFQRGVKNWLKMQ